MKFVFIAMVTVYAQYSAQDFEAATKWIVDFRKSQGNSDPICNDPIINEGALVSAKMAAETKKPHGGFEAGLKYVSDKTGGKTFANEEGQAWKLDPLAMVKQMCTPIEDEHCIALKSGPACYGIGTYDQTTSIMYAGSCDCSRGTATTPSPPADAADSPSPAPNAGGTPSASDSAGTTPNQDSQPAADTPPSTETDSAEVDGGQGKEDAAGSEADQPCPLSQEGGAGTPASSTDTGTPPAADEQSAGEDASKVEGASTESEEGEPEGADSSGSSEEDAAGTGSEDTAADMGAGEVDAASTEAEGDETDCGDTEGADAETDTSGTQPDGSEVQSEAEGSETAPDDQASKVDAASTEADGRESEASPEDTPTEEPGMEPESAETQAGAGSETDQPCNKNDQQGGLGQSGGGISGGGQGRMKYNA